MTLGLSHILLRNGISDGKATLDNMKVLREGNMVKAAQVWSTLSSNIWSNPFHADQRLWQFTMYSKAWKSLCWVTIFSTELMPWWLRATLSLMGNWLAALKINWVLWYLNTATSSKFPRISLSFRPNAVCHINAEYTCLNMAIQAIINPCGVTISSKGENRSLSLKLQQAQRHSRPICMTTAVCLLLTILVKCCRTTKIKAKIWLFKPDFHIRYCGIHDGQTKVLIPCIWVLDSKKNIFLQSEKKNWDLPEGKNQPFKSSISSKKEDRDQSFGVHWDLLPITGGSQVQDRRMMRSSFLFSELTNLSGLDTECLTILTLTLNN